MKVRIRNQIVHIPERTEAFLDTRGRCRRKTITLTEQTILQIQRLEREHNSSMSAVIRSAVDLLSRGVKNG